MILTSFSPRIELVKTIWMPTRSNPVTGFLHRKLIVLYYWLFDKSTIYHLEQDSSSNLIYIIIKKIISDMHCTKEFQQTI